MIDFYNQGSVEFVEFLKEAYIRSATTELELREEKGINCGKVFIPIGSIDFLSIITADEVMMKEMRDFLNGTEKHHTVLFVHFSSLEQVEQKRQQYDDLEVTRWKEDFGVGNCSVALALIQDICVVLVYTHTH